MAQTRASASACTRSSMWCWTPVARSGGRTALPSAPGSSALHLDCRGPCGRPTRHDPPFHHWKGQPWTPARCVRSPLPGPARDA
eukprot:6797656-Lingulodinium_polyedra.AAC.1